MSIKFMSTREQKEFWRTHNKARQARDKRLARLSFSDKIDIAQRLWADYEVLGAGSVWGLGEIPANTFGVIASDMSHS